jgi:Fur family ferric uptake transcriptional regulator
MKSDPQTLLKKSDLRVTSVRSDVLKVFIDASTAIDTHTVEASFDNIDRITLYRTLKTFEEKGLIHSVVDSNGVTKYAMCEDGCTSDHKHDEHVHFHCQKCDEVVCLDGLKVPSLDLPKGYKADKANLIVTGLCDKC